MLVQEWGLSNEKACSVVLSNRRAWSKVQPIGKQAKLAQHWSSQPCWAIKAADPYWAPLLFSPSLLHGEIPLKGPTATPFFSPLLPLQVKLGVSSRVGPLELVSPAESMVKFIGQPYHSIQTQFEVFFLLWRDYSNNVWWKKNIPS